MRRMIREELKALTEQPPAYGPEYNILTIYFADGSEPGALSIPYASWEPRTDLHVPYRLVKVDGSPQP